MKLQVKNTIIGLAAIGLLVGCGEKKANPVQEYQPLINSSLEVDAQTFQVQGINEAERRNWVRLVFQPGDTSFDLARGTRTVNFELGVDKEAIRSYQLQLFNGSSIGANFLGCTARPGGQTDLCRVSITPTDNVARSVSPYGQMTLQFALVINRFRDRDTFLNAVDLRLLSEYNEQSGTAIVALSQRVDYVMSSQTPTVNWEGGDAEDAVIRAASERVDQTLTLSIRDASGISSPELPEFVPLADGTISEQMSAVGAHVNLCSVLARLSEAQRDTRQAGLYRMRFRISSASLVQSLRATGRAQARAYCKFRIRAANRLAVPAEVVINANVGVPAAQ